MSVNNIHVKLQFGSEYRRFIIQSDTKFSQLKGKISTILNLKEDFSIRYLDEEQEWITIGSDVELETGIVLVDKIFRIQVELHNPHINTTTKVEETPKETNNANTNDVTQTDDLDEDDKFWRRGRGKGRGNRYHGDGKKHHGDGKKHWKRDWKKEKWDHKGSRFEMNDSGDSGDENLALDDIKKEVSSLSEELKLLVSKKKTLREELVVIKNKIVEGRRDSETPKQTILDLRDSLGAKKGEMKNLWLQIRNSKTRIQKLRSIAVTKTQ